MPGPRPTQALQAECQNPFLKMTSLKPGDDDDDSSGDDYDSSSDEEGGYFSDDEDGEEDEDFLPEDSIDLSGIRDRIVAFPVATGPNLSTYIILLLLLLLLLRS